MTDDLTAESRLVAAIEQLAKSRNGHGKNGGVAVPWWVGLVVAPLVASLIGAMVNWTFAVHPLRDRLHDLETAFGVLSTTVAIHVDPTRTPKHEGAMGEDDIKDRDDQLRDDLRRLEDRIDRAIGVNR